MVDDLIPLVYATTMKKSLEQSLHHLYRPGTLAADILAFENAVIRAVERKDILLHQGAYLIAGTLGHQVVDYDKKLWEIASLAAELEIPSDSNAAVRNPTEKFTELKKLITEYANLPHSQSSLQL